MTGVQTCALPILLSAYRHLAKADEKGVLWLDLGLPTVGAKPSLAGRVRDYLRDEDMLLDKISPRRIIGKAWEEHEPTKAVDEIYEAFLKYPHLPMLESKQVLLEAVAQGVREGVFGVRVGERVFFKENIGASVLAAETVLLREPTISQRVPETTSGPGGEMLPPPPGVQEGPTAATDAGKAPGPTIPAYTLEAGIPWDKLSDFVRGVVTPLRQDGAELEIMVTLKARTESGIKQTTLEQKVRETLRQIGATVFNEEPRGPSGSSAP